MYFIPYSGFPIASYKRIRLTDDWVLKGPASDRLLPLRSNLKPPRMAEVGYGSQLHVRQRYPDFFGQLCSIGETGGLLMYKLPSIHRGIGSTNSTTMHHGITNAATDGQGQQAPALPQCPSPFFGSRSSKEARLVPWSVAFLFHNLAIILSGKARNWSTSHNGRTSNLTAGCLALEDLDNASSHVSQQLGEFSGPY